VALDKKDILIVLAAFLLLGISFFAYKFDVDVTGFLVQGKADLTVVVVDGSNNHPIRDAKIYVKDVDKDLKGIYSGRTDRQGMKTIRLSQGTYVVEITREDFSSKSFSVLLLDGDEREVSVVLYPSGYAKTCSDKTPIQSCSTQPWYCDSEGVLTRRCDLCSCPQGLRCTSDGSCA